jgi:hypothetical protein
LASGPPALMPVMAKRNGHTWRTGQAFKRHKEEPTEERSRYSCACPTEEAGVCSRGRIVAVRARRSGRTLVRGDSCGNPRDSGWVGGWGKCVPRDFESCALTACACLVLVAPCRRRRIGACVGHAFTVQMILWATHCELSKFVLEEKNNHFCSFLSYEEKKRNSRCMTNM